MDITSTERSLRLLEGLHRAIPALLAPGDFVGNLETSLQILGDVLSLHTAFLLVNPKETAPTTASEINRFRPTLAMEKRSGNWQAFVQSNHTSGLLDFFGEPAARLLAGNRDFRPFKEIFHAIQLDWPVRNDEPVYLIPLITRGVMKGILGLGFTVEKLRINEREKSVALTYADTLANWLERNERFRSVRRERDCLRDLNTDGIYYMNCGIPIDIGLPADEQLNLYYEHAFIEDANPAIAAMYQVDRAEDLIGTRVFDLHQGKHYEENQRSFLNLVHNDYRVESVNTVETTPSGKLKYFRNSAVGEIVDDKLIGIWGTQQDITVNREIEIAKQESEVISRNLFEKNPLGVIIGDAKGNLLRCNERFAEMLGYTVEELQQKTWMDITHPDEISGEGQLVDEAIDQRESIMFIEKRYIHREGYVVWTNMNMSLLYNRDGSLKLVLAMIEDITEKRKIHLQLEKSEAFQKAILQTLPDLKFRISKEGMYLDHYPSPNDEQDLLAPPEVFLGKQLDEVLPGYLARAVLANVKKAIRTNELQAFEYMLPVKGNMSHFEIRINAINQDEVIAIVRNVSERNWAQFELKQKIRELDEKNRQLKDYIDSNMQLENFAYIASHDLREPLRTMGTFAQLLEKKYAGKLDQTAKTYIEFVVQGSKNLNNLIEDLLTYSRIQSQENRMEAINLPELLQEVIGGLKESIVEQQATIETFNIPDQVLANPNRLKQLIQNLLANAIKFKDPGIPVMVQVHCSDRGDEWQFEIRDNGIGIDPEYHGKIFLLFKKLHSRKDFQGTGLGLAICKKVVEQMGGNIWLESELGKGSSFFFTMKKAN